MKADDPHRSLASALGRVPSGIYVLTVTRGAVETGLLSSWVQQCSFEPPQISVAIRPDRAITALLEPGSRFTLNILEASQTDIIVHFGRGFALDEAAFAGLEVRREPPMGPVLIEALAYLDCEVAGRVSAGTTICSSAGCWPALCSTRASRWCTSARMGCTTEGKSEIRISKSETNSKSEIARPRMVAVMFGHLDFEFVSDFDIRISDLRYHGPLLYLPGRGGRALLHVRPAHLCCAWGENCHRCDTAVIPGNPRSRQISVQPLRSKAANHGWWRPQQAEEFEPPACYECKGLARAVCRNCRNHYCREHAGTGALCQACGRSARLGLIVFALALAIAAGVLLLGAFTR